MGELISLTSLFFCKAATPKKSLNELGISYIVEKSRAGSESWKVPDLVPHELAVYLKMAAKENTEGSDSHSFIIILSNMRDSDRESP